MTIESKLAIWAKQAGAFVSNSEREFIACMRLYASKGVGYGWMQQLIEWEWQSKGQGSWGPEYVETKIKELEKQLEIKTNDDRTAP